MVSLRDLSKLSGFGKIGALRVGAHPAELAHDAAFVVGVGGRKRGHFRANCCPAKTLNVGWLSRTWRRESPPFSRLIR